MTASRPQTALAVDLRPATPADLDALVALENRSFIHDRISRRSFRHFVGAQTAAVIVARHGAALAGYALVLFRAGSAIARLYSIAVAAESAGRGVGPALLAAADATARRRGARVMRLEVHEHNAAAISRYRKSGYSFFGRRDCYYGDGATALRYDKRLSHSPADDESPPPPSGLRA